jgi:hypothetical protein
MSRFAGNSLAVLSRLAALAALPALICFGAAAQPQESANERSFPQSKAAIEKVLQHMEAASSGRLPVLDGFATPIGHSLDRYQRGYYQAKFQVTPSPAGGTVVRVNVQVTAYYVDPSGAKSGYQLLPSNGRLEQDLLDQLGEQLAGSEQRASRPEGAAPKAANQASSSASSSLSPSTTVPSAETEPTLSAPMPRLPDLRGEYSSNLAGSLAEQQKSRTQSGAQPSAKKIEEDAGPLQAEINSLQEVLKNQAHPKNLVAVKNSGTPVVSSASLNAKTLFLATAHDEFEMLDFNRDWVHVKISGLSRGWIWRNNLEMPGDIPESDIPPPPGSPGTALFHVTREEIAPFPGDWAPLRDKKVKIVSLEPTDDNAKDPDPKLRLEFAKTVLDKNYAELAKKSQELAGIVLIFDSADGGMIAATLTTLQRWKAGAISDAALWHQCFFDPPETFTPVPAAAAASR